MIQRNRSSKSRLNFLHGNTTLLFSLSMLAGILGWAPQASADVATAGSPIQYWLDGTLEEGGHFFGKFTVDPLAVDQEPHVSFGRFALREVDLQLIDTQLFMSGGNTATSGSTITGELYQSEFSQSQTLLFTLHADGGNSNAFTDLEFGPFLGDPNVAAAIEAPFLGGYFDGSGQSEVVSLTLARIPEPASFTLLLAGALLAAAGRRH